MRIATHTLANEFFNAAMQMAVFPPSNGVVSGKVFHALISSLPREDAKILRSVLLLTYWLFLHRLKG
jgi:predicted acyltransferase